MGLMSILVQLLHVRYLFCLPAYLSVVSLPGRGPGMEVWFESDVPGSCSLRAALPGHPLSSRFGSGCTHLLQTSFGLPPFGPGAGVVPALSRLRAGGCRATRPISATVTPWASTFGPAASPGAERFSRRS